VLLLWWVFDSMLGKRGGEGRGEEGRGEGERAGERDDLTLVE